MLSIGSKGNVDRTAIITYTIDGLPGSPTTKNFMYEAKTIKEFKVKLETFDLMQPKFARDQPSKSTKVHETHEKTKERTKWPEQTRCKNCGSKTHNSDSCPDKGKGPKCFSCNDFGHLSRSCSSPKKLDTKRVNVIQRNTAQKTVKINDEEVTALIDTGSDITTIRKKTINEKNLKAKLLPNKNTVKGVGGSTSVKGKFAAKIAIDNDTYETDCYVLPDESFDDELIVGLDIINQRLITRTGINMTKYFEQNKSQQTDEMTKTETQCLQQINYIGLNEQNSPDLSHIMKPATKQKI